jgi:hypothetical protein
LQGFVLDVADRVAGEYLDQLGGPLSFLCDPFSLDIRIALATYYASAREGNTSQSSCTLTGALANLESFVAGDFAQGGWESWLAVTSKPEVYTPYGSYLRAESELEIKINDTVISEKSILDFGNGFLSSKICTPVASNTGIAKENCVISTPGQVISEALTFQLSTGPRTLIEADEINEIISALMGQLTQKAITGAAGLLGLSDGTGYTYSGFSGGSYINQMSSAAETLNMDPSEMRGLLLEAENLEVEYQTQALAYQKRLYAFAASGAQANRRNEARAAAIAIDDLLLDIDQNLLDIDGFIKQYDALPKPELDTPITSQQRSQILQDFSKAKSRFHNEAQLEGDIARWQGLVS